ncbi:MAG: hypothetical protein JRG93_20385 [Deltaproteobacteria bacterium]|nr:hypothetical protein [Deltaproteobacteria bacterium]
MTNTGKAYAVIMAGGSGTRFWPLSRSTRPKQLLALGPDDRSLPAPGARARRSIPTPRNRREGVGHAPRRAHAHRDVRANPCTGRTGAS